MGILNVDISYVERLLKQMIAIDSILPHEGELVEFIAGEIRSLGVEPILEWIAPGRPNLYASVELGPSDRSLVFSGHSDTVPAALDWETDPFEPVVQNGRLYGLGAINMKSGLACMMGAFKALKEAPPLAGRGGRIGLAVCVDQEGHSIGARALLKSDHAKCDAMLHAEHFFGDSADDYLPVAVTGKVLYKLTVHGRAAHAFRPEQGGINAIVDAASIITALNDMKLKEDPILGRGNLCVLKIDGGYREYSVVVPERCEIVITRLTVGGETVETAEEEMRQLIGQLELKSRIDVEIVPPGYDPYFVDTESALMKCFTGAYRQVIGDTPHFAAHRGIVDANVFNGEGGIPTIVFGPKGGLHHRAGEYVELASLRPVVEVYARTAIRFFEQVVSRGE